MRSVAGPPPHLHLYPDGGEGNMGSADRRMRIDMQGLDGLPSIPADEFGRAEDVAVHPLIRVHLLASLLNRLRDLR